MIIRIIKIAPEAPIRIIVFLFSPVVVGVINVVVGVVGVVGVVNVVVGVVLLQLKLIPVRLARCTSVNVKDCSQISMDRLHVLGLNTAMPSLASMQGG